MTKIYTREEAVAASTEYFGGDELAATVFVNKYALKNKAGEILELTPEAMHWRIAKEIARIELKYPNPLSEKELFELMDEFKYIVPSGSPMTGIGNDYQIASLSNCFVINHEYDSYGAIMRTDENLVQLMKRRGGVGTDLSHIRYIGALTNNSAIKSSGMPSFMDRYSNSTREVSQEGRRGALMLSVSVKHPDAEHFIDAKMQEGKVTGANISVRVLDDFMQAVVDGISYSQQFPVDSSNPEIVQSIDAKKLWDKMMFNSWKSAEPSILFWDTIIKESLPDCYADLGYKTVSTNPCIPDYVKVIEINKGEIKLNELNIGDYIWSKEGWTEVVNIISSGEKEVFSYETETGECIHATRNHKFISNGVKKEAYLCDSVEVLSRHFSNEVYESKIVKTKSMGVMPVFDITVDNSSHTFWCSGINISNCGEIPLCSHDSCRLLAINLHSYVTNPFTEFACFDFQLFQKHVRIAQRMMDDIVDLELEKITAILNKIASDPEPDYIKRPEIELWEEIYKKTSQGRRTGLGITAEGDMIAALGLKYGTPEATSMSATVHQLMAENSYASSVIMAKERGCFEIFDADREKDNPFLNRVILDNTINKSNGIIDMYKEYGRRNIANLTIAPTGTTSLMTQTTSGIEPVFLPVYKRRRKVNPNDEGVKVAFVDITGDAFEEYIVFHHKFKDWMNINGHTLPENPSEADINALIKISPYYQATSNDVDWVEKVRMQGEVQKWIDHSISVTVNLPNDVPVELVSDIYMTAWKSGCKGMTIYRDGSRDGVLMGIEDKKPELETETEEVFNYKRPKSLNADILRFSNNKEKWVAFVGLRDGKPYEIFTGRIDSDSLSIPAKIEHGVIRKRKVNGIGVYDFEYELNGEKVVVPELSKQFNKEYWNYAKLISGNLRHHMPVEQVVKLVQSLYFDNDTINSWRTGVVRALKRYIKDGTEASGVTCPDCGSQSVIYQEGCLICTSCGSSKCG